MNSVALVSIHNGLAIDVKRAEIKSKIINRVAELGLNIIDYRMNNEMLLLILNLVEHLVVRKSGINKKELALDILQELFTFNAQEKVSVDKNIEFLWSNKNIKKVSQWKLFCAGFKELFWKKKN